MVANKWLAGAGTSALTPAMFDDACCYQEDVCCNQDGACYHQEDECCCQEGACCCQADAYCCQEDVRCCEGGKAHASESIVEEKTLVCASNEVLQYPETLLLSDAQFCNLPFVCTERVSYNARTAFQNEEVTQALVHSSNDMSALNLAASLKRDFPSKHVVLVADNNDTDFLRRAALTLVDAIIPVSRFYQTLLAQHIQAPHALQGPQISSMENPTHIETRAELALQDDVFSQGVPTLNFDMSELEEPPVTLLEPSVNLLQEGSCKATAEEQKVSRIAAPFETTVTPSNNSPSNNSPNDNKPGENNAKARAFFLPVISASGGTGTSTIAYLAALSSVQLGCKTLLIDLDLQFGDELLYSQADQPLSITQLAQNPSEVAKLQPTPEGYYFISSCDTPEQSEDIQANLQHILHAAFTSFDVVIANGPTTWNDSHIELLEQAGKIFFVLDQRLSSVRSAQKAFDLCMRCGLAASPFLFLLNKCNKQSALTYLDVTCATQGTPCKELPDGGRLVSEYLEARQASCLFEEKNNFARVLFDIVADTLPGCNVLKDTHQNRHAPRFLIGKKHRKECE